MFALFKKTKHLHRLMHPDGKITPNSIHMQLLRPDQARDKTASKWGMHYKSIRDYLYKEAVSEITRILLNLFARVKNIYEIHTY